jgi:uncharacterized membrane-anchored protein YhcB (DUF1043 family)
MGCDTQQDTHPLSGDMFMLEVALFLLGLMIGALGCFLVMNQGRSESAVEKKLRELQEEFTAYRENVNQHFSRTADLVNNLTQSYVKVQKHLEEASVSFAEPPKSFALEPSGNSTDTAPQFIALETREKTQQQDASFGDIALQPPRDYAPKTSPKEKGTLAEDFGFDRPPF